MEKTRCLVGIPRWFSAVLHRLIQEWRAMLIARLPLYIPPLPKSQLSKRKQKYCRPVTRCSWKPKEHFLER